MSENDDEKEQDQDLKKKLLNNRGLCYLQINEYQQASNDGIEALKIDNDWIKARYTLCSALYGMKKYKQALSILSVNKDQTKTKQASSASMAVHLKKLKQKLKHFMNGMIIKKN